MHYQVEDMVKIYKDSIWPNARCKCCSNSSRYRQLPFSVGAYLSVYGSTLEINRTQSLKTVEMRWITRTQLLICHSLFPFLFVFLEGSSAAGTTDLGKWCNVLSRSGINILEIRRVCYRRQITISDVISARLNNIGYCYFAYHFMNLGGVPRRKLRKKLILTLS